MRTLKTLSHFGKLTWNELKASLLSPLSLVYLLSCDHVITQLSPGDLVPLSGTQKA